MSDSQLEEATGTIDGVNVDFTTAVAYYPGTLFAYLNGLLVEQDGDDGPIEMGGVNVRMRTAPSVNDTLHFWYRTEAPTPGAFLAPPRAYHALNLVPEPRSASNLRPDPHSVEVPTAGGDEVPRSVSAIDLRPEPFSTDNLRPKPISAEEI
jgi:hypothetical protein